jgi:AraC-like DNA-binding protein
MCSAISSEPGDRRRWIAQRGEARHVPIDPDVIDEVASTNFGVPASFIASVPVSREANRQWASAAGFVHRQLVAHPETAALPLVGTNLARMLAAVLLSAFPNTAFASDQSTPVNTTPSVLRRAIEVIEGNAHLDLTLTQIADAAHVGTRSIQLAFRRYLDTTPLAYLRDVRLDRAHQDLLAADASATTVTAIAARWGFASSGRFATRYRQRFGELPSRTLRD